MGGFAKRSLDAPDETRTFELGSAEIVQLAGSTAVRNTMEPGWRWSTNVGPVVGTETCQVHHVGQVLSGSLRVRASDGQEYDLNEGDVYEILPGHDGWVVGDATYRSLEFLTKPAEDHA